MKHADYNKIYLLIIPPSQEVTPSRLHESQVSTGTFILTNSDWFTSVLNLTLELGFSVPYLPPDRSTQRGPGDLSSPFVKDRHTFHQALTDICAAFRSTQKSFFHSFAFVRNLFGSTEVFNERHPAPDVFS